VPLLSLATEGLTGAHAWQLLYTLCCPMGRVAAGPSATAAHGCDPLLQLLLYKFLYPMGRVAAGPSAIAAHGCDPLLQLPCTPPHASHTHTGCVAAALEVDSQWQLQTQGLQIKHQKLAHERENRCNTNIVV
jgi:hypothetical protein